MSARRFVVAAIAAGLIAAMVAILSDSSPSRNAAAIVTAGQPGPLDPLSAAEIETAFWVIEASQQFPEGA